MKPSLLLAAGVALLSAGVPVRADEAAPASRDAAPTADGTPRIRATHRVDVIAPGERVESVIDRMRAQGAATPREARPTDAASTGADRRGERPMDQRPAGAPSGGMMGSPGAAGSTQGPMPGMGPGGSGTRGDMPPPDRMRRR